MFNLAIASKLRGCDVVGIKVEDVAPHGYSADCATVSLLLANIYMNRFLEHCAAE